jgi:transketolase
MRKVFIDALVEQARVDDRLFLVVNDMGFTVVERFRDEFPNRFLNAGVAEQNAVGVAAGLALSGFQVYVYSIIPFVTMRCFEQVRVDLAYMNTNVRLVGVGAGYTYGALGATHHAIEDIAIMRALPNMTICCPGSLAEAKALFKQSFHHQGPIYFRLGYVNNPDLVPKNADIKLGKALHLLDGKDMVLITTSTMLEMGKKWIDEWAVEGKTVALISMHTMKPFDSEAILKLIQQKIPIITLEEHNIIGGLGSAVAEVIADSDVTIPLKRIAVPDVYTHVVGGQDFLRDKLGLKRPDWP